MSKSLSFIEKCALCDTEIEVTENNRLQFYLTWYESLFFNLCPACQATPEGMRKIKRDRKQRKLGIAGMQKG